MTGLVIFFQRIQNNLEMFFITKKISICCVNKEGFDSMLLDVTGVCFPEV